MLRLFPMANMLLLYYFPAFFNVLEAQAPYSESLESEIIDDNKNSCEADCKSKFISLIPPFLERATFYFHRSEQSLHVESPQQMLLNNVLVDFYRVAKTSKRKFKYTNLTIGDCFEPLNTFLEKQTFTEDMMLAYLSQNQEITLNYFLDNFLFSQ